MGVKRMYRQALRLAGSVAISAAVLIVPAVGAANAGQGYAPKLGSGGSVPATTLPLLGGGQQPPSPAQSSGSSQSSSSSSSVLAFTGAEITGMTGGAAVAIGVGGFLVLATRRRRRLPA